MKPTRITLPSGTPFSQCDQTLRGEWTRCDVRLTETRNAYTGEFKYDNGGSFVATFASPTIADCEGPPPYKECAITLRFSQGDLALIQLLPNIDLPSSPKPSIPAPPKPEPISSEGLGLSECQDPLNCGVSFVATNAPYILLIILVLGGLTFFASPLKRSIFGNDNTRSRPKTRRKTSSSPSSQESTSSSFSSSSSAGFSPDADLSHIHTQLQEIKRLLQDQETRLIALESASTGASVRGLSLKNESPQTQVTSSGLPTELFTPPQPLSVDLILHAVSKPDYSLIQTYPHFFLNETQDSRQGKLESKRFDVVGDQQASSSLANAEFIAIPVDSRTYIIPNLLSNAADPRRTLKRHADANSIYRAGAGSNILKIQSLAEVERTSTTVYELIKIGQIE